MNRSMMPQQIMRLAGGGGISSFIPRNTTIMGQPHYLAYINPQEGQLLKDLGGAGLPGPGGVPAYWELFKPSTWGDGKGYQGTGLNLGGGSSKTSDKDDDDDDSGPTLSASAAAQVNDVRQDENGNWYAVTQIEGTNALGRDYSIDPKDNSQGPTFGGNVSENIKENFSEEVEEAGGSTDRGSISDTFKDTDKEALGFDPTSNTFVSVESSLDKEKDGTTVRREERENTLKQNIANLLTPLDDKQYVDGVLVNTTTGNAVSQFGDQTGQGFADNLMGAGILGLSGKQVPDAPFTQGNTPMLKYMGGDDATRSYEVLGGLDPNADPSMSYNEDGTLFVPYGGKDPYSFDASTNFPGSTDYNMSKDLAETGSYINMAEGSDTFGQRVTPGGPPGTNKANSFDDYKFQDNLIATLSEEGKAHLLATGDDSKMIVKDPITGRYEYIDGSPVLNPNTGEEIPAFDATGGDVGFGDGDGNVGGGDGNDSSGDGSGGVDDGGSEDIEEDTDEEEKSESSSSLNFYAGYNPVGVSDVLVQNPNVGIPYVPTTDPRIMPLRSSGITSLYNFPASRFMYQGIMS